VVCFSFLCATAYCSSDKGVARSGEYRLSTGTMRSGSNLYVRLDRLRSQETDHHGPNPRSPGPLTPRHAAGGLIELHPALGDDLRPPSQHDDRRAGRAAHACVAKGAGAAAALGAPRPDLAMGLLHPTGACAVLWRRRRARRGPTWHAHPGIAVQQQRPRMAPARARAPAERYLQPPRPPAPRRAAHSAHGRRAAPTPPPSPHPTAHTHCPTTAPSSPCCAMRASSTSLTLTSTIGPPSSSSQRASMSSGCARRRQRCGGRPLPCLPACRQGGGPVMGAAPADRETATQSGDCAHRATPRPAARE
jgi:hypothetical protein